ncbi:MAG: hypothetical protein IJ242_15710 [Clostridia bacterium]|nr:hypothetical protein [Clostridia bacterium]
MYRLKGILCSMVIGLCLLVPEFVLASTYVFPYEGFRYTQQGEETVLTQTNLESQSSFLESLGTNVDAVLANYLANGIAMEVIMDAGQIAVSVADNPYYGGTETLNELDINEKNDILQQFESSGLYESSNLVDTKWGTIRVTSSAMYASMPVYSIRYLTMANEKLYTLTMTVIGRQIEAADDEAVLTVLDGMQLFEARKQAEAVATSAPAVTPKPKPEQKYATLNIVEGSMSIDPVSETIYEETAILNGLTDAGATVTVLCDGQKVGQATANNEGQFTVRVRLPELGENSLVLETENARAELMLIYMLPLAEIKILEPENPAFTGGSVLVRGDTVPNATVYFNGGQINTNVTANRNGQFSIRLTLERAGKVELKVRSHASGYSDETIDLVLERVLTEREQIAAFRQSALVLDYETLVNQPGTYADKGFIFRGRVMDYTDYNGRPCALVCVSNPSTGIWNDPLYIVIDTDNSPSIGDIMTFYMTGEGITLPAEGIYTRSGETEEAPVAHAFYITTNR